MTGTANQNGYKVCSTCLKKKKIKEFWKYKYSRDGYNPMCKDCKKISSLKSLYKITLKEAKKYYKESMCGKCMICGISAKDHLKQYNKPLSVDHCHIHGHIRGVICQKCNMALGLIEDNPEVLDKMISYLKD